MDPFWKSFFEDFRERGRDATPFLFTLAALVVLLIVGGIFDEITRDPAVADFMRRALPWAGTIAVVGILVSVIMAIRRARNRRRERWQRHELSCDEWRVARSKLKSGLNKFNSVKPVSRPPDTDLKM
jgi:hypothetical protein